VAAKRFRIVLRTDSHFRLMERAGDDPMTWNLNTRDPEGDETAISIRDEVEVRGQDVPVHTGLVIVVECSADSLEEGIDKAEGDAAVALGLLSAVARAPTANRRLLLGYDITPGQAERRIRQWFWETPFALGKTPVPQHVFGDLFKSFTKCSDRKLSWRLSQSVSWHQRALGEADAVARYMGLWIANEALEPRLRELFGVKVEESEAESQIAFPGLKALAEAEGVGGGVVKDAYTLRNNLFHARRVEAPVLVTEARRLIPQLEALLPSAWARLLGISERTSDFPETSVVPHELGMFFDAVLLGQDEKQWDGRRHPYFAGKIDAVRRPTEDPRDLSADYPTNLQVRNVGEEGDATWRALGVGIVGPSGPHVGTGSVAGPEIVAP
jgi:hypothetical protein